MSLNSQNDLLGIMNLIHHATGNIEAKAEVDERMEEIGTRMKTLRDQQSKSYAMYWTK
jgi:chaperonin cofactor prefoldin